MQRWQAGSVVAPTQPSGPTVDDIMNADPLEATNREVGVARDLKEDNGRVTRGRDAGHPKPRTRLGRLAELARSVFENVDTPQ